MRTFIIENCPSPAIAKLPPEISAFPKLFLNPHFKALVDRGASDQGYIYFVNLTTGEINGLAAVNVESDEKQKLKPSSLIAAVDSVQEGKKILKPSQTKKASQETKIIVLDKNNKPFDSKDFVTTNLPRTTQTGGTGGGDLHKKGAALLKLVGPQLAGGFWIDGEFRTRSTQNMLTLLRNPAFKIFFSQQAPTGGGHQLAYAREMPFMYFAPVIKEIYSKIFNKELKTIEQLKLELPKSTVSHYEIELDWIVNKGYQLYTNDFFSEEFQKTKKDIVTEKVSVMLDSFENKEFKKENCSLKAIALLQAITHKKKSVIDRMLKTNDEDCIKYCLPFLKDSKNSDILRVFLENDIQFDVNELDDQKLTYLDKALKNRDVYLMQLLIRKGAYFSENLPKEYFRRYIEHIVLQDNRELIQFSQSLIREEKDSEIFIDMAIKENKINTISSLVEIGLIPSESVLFSGLDSNPNLFKIILESAIEFRNVGIIALLKEWCDKSQNSFPNMIIENELWQKFSELNEIYPVDLEEANHSNVPPLLYAIQKDSVDCVRFLLEQKVNVNKINNERSTLYTALTSWFNVNQSEILSILLNDGASFSKYEEFSYLSVSNTFEESKKIQSRQLIYALGKAEKWGYVGLLLANIRKEDSKLEEKECRYLIANQEKIKTGLAKLSEYEEIQINMEDNHLLKAILNFPKTKLYPMFGDKEQDEEPEVEKEKENQFDRRRDSF